MTPIFQTNYGRDQGDCLTACVASILDVPINSVPEFCVDGEWFDRLDSFCRENGFFLVYWRHSENLPIICLNAYVILLLELEGEDTLHAVVVKTEIKEKIPMTEAEVEAAFALGELAGSTRGGATRWAWRSQLVHDPNERGYPAVKGPVGYIMIGKQ